MIEVESITAKLADSILGKYSDNPLLACLECDEAHDLLTASYYVVNMSAEACILTPELFKVDSNDASGHHKDHSVPSSLLYGTLRYRFLGDTDLPAAVINAPFTSYILPNASESHLPYPSIAASGHSCGVVFNPKLFKQIIYKNIDAVEIILQDRERKYNMLLEWLPINTIAPIQDRIARFLLAQLPHDCSKQVQFGITHSTLAQHLKCSRATLAKGISYLFDRKIISTGHGKLVVNVEKLKDYSMSSKNPPPPIIRDL